MIKRTPSFAQLMMMALFALSCFALLLFLWSSFGGSTPFKPKGYRFTASFSEAVSVAVESDVRISGVSVGKVKRIEPSLGDTRVTLQINEQYAPIPRDTRAILRSKSLLGETFVELSPGSPGGPKLPDNGHLERSQVAPTVELDEVFRGFDIKTRRAFQDWFASQGEALRGRGSDLSAALGTLPIFFDRSEDVVRVLDRQGDALKVLTRDSGELFNALSENRGQLGGLVRDANAVFRATGSRDQELASTVRQLPRLLDESTATVKRIDRFQRESGPFIDQAREIARESVPVLRKTARLSGDARTVFTELDPLMKKADTGIPATENFLKDVQPLLGQLDPFLRDFNPVLDWIGRYQRELTAFLANSSSSVQGVDSIDGMHFFRALLRFSPEALAYFPQRIESNRANPYRAPGSYAKIFTGGLEVFESAFCAGVPVPPLNPDPDPRLSPEVRALIEKYIYGAGGSVAAPPCVEQQPFTVGGVTTQYPQLRERSTP